MHTERSFLRRWIGTIPMTLGLAQAASLLLTGCGGAIHAGQNGISLLPMITSLSPVSPAADGTNFNLGINGTNFTPTSTSSWGETPLATTYVSTTKLTALLPASLIEAPTTASITVSTDAGTAVATVSTTGGALPEVVLAVSTPAPAIASLSPTSAVAGGAGLTLTINGSNFTSTAVANWGSTSLTTTYVSATRLTAAVSASLIAAAGTTNITVTTSGGSSSSQTFTINPPPPAIANLSPTSAVAGGAGFTLTINGSNFTSTAVANWGATALTTTYVSATRLTAAVSASLIAAAGTTNITVTTSGGSSAGQTFTINPPLPIITSLSPTSVVAGGQAFTLTVNGTNFLPGALASVVKWDYTALATTYISPTQLTAPVPASLTGSTGTATITVITAGGTSTGVSFTIAPPQPIVNSMSPAKLPVGFGAFTLNVYGSHLSSPATVNWGATPLATSWLGSSTLLAQVPASLVESIGTVSVTVTTPGGTSSPLTFSIVQPQPAITSLTPSSTPAGGAGFTLTINGTDFAPNSNVMLGTTWLAVTYVSSTQLTVPVPASLIASAGSSAVIVYIPGIGWSPSATFIIDPSLPVISSLNPATLTAGGAGFMLTINGKAFTSDATSTWGTTPLGTVYVSPTKLIAAVPASLIVEPGSGSVTVTTGAGTSAPASMTIKQAPPAIIGLSPSVASVGGAAFTMTISGVYFTSTTTVKWGSTALTTAFINESLLTVTVPANLIASIGSASITVSTAAGTSAPATFSVYGLPKIVTVALPSGTAGSAYSGPISVTGGVPGYTWTVTGLPDSFTYFNTNGNRLTITGTPAEPGAVTFKVSVEDSAGGSAGPVSYTLNVAAGPNGAGNGDLNGRYVCLLQGFFDDDGTRWASLASFQADGKGHFSTGAFDTNSHAIGSASGTISGSYNIGSDLNGIASLHTFLSDGAAGIQTTQWAVALTSASQPAQEFQMVEADDLGELPSYQRGTADCIRATPAAFGASTISGSSFVFGLEGEDNNGNLRAAAGLFSASAGKISSGSIDLAQGGNANVQTTAFTGSYTAPDPATGRFKIALKSGGNPTGLTVYIIDSNRMFVLDNTSNDGEEAGNVRTQQQAVNSAGLISGPFVLYMRGAEFNDGAATPSGYYAAVLQGTGDGGGNLSINQSYKDDNGIYSAGNAKAGPIALDFDAAHPGRSTFQSAGVATYLYFFDTSSALEMSVGNNGALDTGWLEPQVAPRTASQTESAFTSAALAGNFLFGELPLFDGESNGRVGELDLSGSGTINGAASTSGEENLAWDQAASMTYSWDATAPGTGTFLVTDSAQVESSCAVINPAKFVCTPQSDPSPSIEVMEQ